MNCIGVPIEFYKSTTYSNHPTTGDLSTRYQNIGCTYSASVLNNVPNVLNIYIFANTSYGTGANGWAYLPTGTNAQNVVVMSRAAFNTFTYPYPSGYIDCGNPSLGLSIVLIHEFGHILGLHHTHNEANATSNALICPTAVLREITLRILMQTLDCLMHVQMVVDAINHPIIVLLPVVHHTQLISTQSPI
ncbi:MAG: hypothetical protein IPK35_07105 [Saprospiraceae bacterium]|nr:hypothetical protein [Saprospiraceae bacterium]